MLSLNIATCVPVVMSHTSSMTNHSISSPAHSKYELVSLPLGLELEIISHLMSYGHSNRNKVGMQDLFSPPIIPPTPLAAGDGYEGMAKLRNHLLELIKWIPAPPAASISGATILE